LFFSQLISHSLYMINLKRSLQPINFSIRTSFCETIEKHVSQKLRFMTIA
jgi:hypothetical protein